ncbi:hypothetical protein [Streptomyces sp. NBC_01264]|uniref:hypothetical protein n=1 Tax=Streptomyces sp. NBC_01264 TaxID=2903804 RepID=UPI002254436B|nr:hypothetical protein [Streptomyces sp. NBC_01264]MCX4780544.1 hypothetical protein [Streptomyces sp. NBC_01264]
MPDRPQPDRPTDDNPFAAPPEGRPDQLWEPRAGGDGRDQQNPGSGPGADPGSGPARWDPTDPIQRRARYALLAGMWGFFFGVFGIPSMGLLLGALALYWGISALRGTPVKPAGDGAPGASDGPRGPRASAADVGTGTGRGAATDAVAAPGAARGGLAAMGAAARPQRTAATSGLVTASLAILLALSSYAVQLTYKDFYVCKQDALTKAAELQCNDLLPDNFIGKMLEVQR